MLITNWVSSGWALGIVILIDGQLTPSFSAASLVPCTRLLIFCQAVSRAKSGDPWLGFSSMLNGEKPQSSVAPSCSFGMKLAARTRRP